MKRSFLMLCIIGIFVAFFCDGVFAATSKVTVNVNSDNFPNIFLNVNIQDTGGNLIRGLNQNSFIIEERSSIEAVPVVEDVISFSENEAGSSITVALVFDVSGSMQGQPIMDAKNAAIQFIDQMGPDDRASLVKFSRNTNVEIVQPVNFVNIDRNQNGVKDIVEAINQLSADGWTALYDGTAKGIESLLHEPQPKAVIVFADGDENNSVSFSRNDAIEYANNNNIPIYPIGVGPQVVGNQIKPMAENTGGEYYEVPAAQDLQEIYLKIARQISSLYLIGYTSHNAQFDGTIRTVRVTHNSVSGYGNYLGNDVAKIELDQSSKNLISISQPENVDLAISGTIIDRDADTQYQNLVAELIYHHVEEAEWTTIALPLILQDNGIYNFSAFIPEFDVRNPGIEYYIMATDGINATYSPYNYQSVPFVITVLPNNPPIIIHSPVTEANPGQSVTITAEITDPDIDDGISSAMLYFAKYDPNQKIPYHQESMTHVIGNAFSAEIPNRYIVKPGVVYFISATDLNDVRSYEGFSSSPMFIQTDEKNIDNDGDGFTENQGDCNDSSPAIHPGATEICGDGIDQDCKDGDCIDPDNTDDDGDGYSENQGDCNDNNSLIYKGAMELDCDGIDQDCNGSDLCPAGCDISVISPVGGDYFQGGTSMNISWRTSGSDCSDYVIIKYALDSESSWKLIAAKAYNNGAYIWYMPNNINSSQCKIKIENFSNPSFSGISNSNFTIDPQPCALALLSPSGGEIWQSGIEKTILWSADGTECADFVQIMYSVNGGNTWLNIVDKIKNNGSYNWMIPEDLVSDNALIRIVDLEKGEMFFDQSQSRFSVVNVPVCSIQVTSPNGSEKWKSGKKVKIKWTFSGNECAALVNIIYSTDGGRSFRNVIAKNVSNTGTYEWLIPETLEADLVRIKIEDASNPGYSDISDSSFVIQTKSGGGGGGGGGCFISSINN